MRFRLRSLLVTVTLVCLALGWWVHWPDHSVSYFEQRLRAAEIEPIRLMASADNYVSVPIDITVSAGGEDFVIEAQPRALNDYLLGCRRYTLKTRFGWCDFVAQHGRLSELNDRYFFGGVEISR